MPLRADLLNPIPGDNPSGVNLRYDPVTDKIKEARRERSRCPSRRVEDRAEDGGLHPGHQDWPAMPSPRKVKTFRSRSGWRTRTSGRRASPCWRPRFEFLQNLLEQFWDTLYPEIEDGDVEVRSAPLGVVRRQARRAHQSAFAHLNKLNWTDVPGVPPGGLRGGRQHARKGGTRATRIKEGKITAEEFDEAAAPLPQASTWTSGAP